MDLDAGARRFRQAPLPATAPFTVVRVHGAYGRAHDWHLAYTRLERPGARHVDGNGQVDQGDGGEDRRHLADANRPAYPPVLRRDHQVLHWHLLRHLSLSLFPLRFDHQRSTRERSIQQYPG